MAGRRPDRPDLKRLGAPTGFLLARGCFLDLTAVHPSLSTEEEGESGGDGTTTMDLSLPFPERGRSARTAGGEVARSWSTRPAAGNAAEERGTPLTRDEATERPAHPTDRRI